MDGSWRPLPGINALVRDERHQELVLQVAERISGFGSIVELRALAGGLHHSATVDSQMSLREAVGLAWAYRGFDTDEVESVSITVHDDTTSGGAAVLGPRDSLSELLPEALDRDPADLTEKG